MIKVFVMKPGKREKTFHDYIKKYTPNGSGKWENIIICDDFKEADYYLISWCGEPRLRQDCPPKTVINTTNEPSWHIPHEDLLGEETLVSRWVTEDHNPIEWRIGKTYSELKENNFPEKTRLLSSITSNIYLSKSKQFLLELLKSIDTKLPRLMDSFGKRRDTGWKIPEGYNYRIDFIRKFSKAYPGVLHLYGREKKFISNIFTSTVDFSTIVDYKGPLEDKWDGLAPYRYSFAFENTSEKNYFTEKIADPILAGCMPIYWGCPNIDEFFPENSYIWLDITEKDAVEYAFEVVNSDFRERNLQALREAKELILDEYQFFPTIKKIIDENTQ